MDDTFSITNKTRGRIPNLPFVEMKEAVLGKKYDLSLVLIGERRSRNLTNEYKNKDKVSDVLSFPLDENSGEIFLTPQKIKRQAHLYGKTPKQHIGFLFIHGLLHLSGLDHGSTMESKEETLSKRFGV